MEHQRKFLGQVEKAMPAGVRFKSEIQRVLGVDRHRAYRIVQRKAKLTLDEAAKLARTYGISLDESLELRPQTVVFVFARLDLSIPGEYRSYLERLLAVLENAAGSPDLELVFVVDDLPIFYAMEFPLLTYFKLFAWYRDMNPDDEVPFEDFRARLQGEDLEPLFGSVSRAYRNMPSTEIWYAHSLSPLLLHLDYYRQLKVFREPGTWQTILGQLEALLKRVENYAARSKKGIGEGCDLEMCLSPVHPGHGKLVVNAGGRRRVVLKLHSINSMATGDTLFCEEVQGSVNGNIRKCKSLSGKSEIERKAYIGGLLKSLKQLRKKWK